MRREVGRCEALAALEDNLMDSYLFLKQVGDKDFYTFTEIVSWITYHEFNEGEDYERVNA